MVNKEDFFHLEILLAHSMTINKSPHREIDIKRPTLTSRDMIDNFNEILSKMSDNSHGMCELIEWKI